MKVSLKPLAEQTVLITGASSGIGLVTARMAAKRRARVMLVARNREALEEAVASIEADGGTAAFAIADVYDRGAVDAAADACVSRFGGIDTWVNNAGTSVYARLVDTPLDEHERLFRTNYFGVVNGCQSALKHMAGGAIVTVGSIASDIPTPVMGAYAASKHAIKAYVQALRMELRADRQPFAVTLIKPSGIDTSIGHHAVVHVSPDAHGRALIPPPVYAPETVARAICDAAEHVRRDVTVGGAGRAQVLVGTHFPQLIDLATPIMRRLLFDRDRPQPDENSMFAPREAGEERSGDNHPRETSAYTAAMRHPFVAGAAALLVAGTAAAILRPTRDD